MPSLSAKGDQSEVLPQRGQEGGEEDRTLQEALPLAMARVPNLAPVSAAASGKSLNTYQPDFLFYKIN